VSSRSVRFSVWSLSLPFLGNVLADDPVTVLPAVRVRAARRTPPRRRPGRTASAHRDVWKKATGRRCLPPPVTSPPWADVVDPDRLGAIGLALYDDPGTAAIVVALVLAAPGVRIFWRDVELKQHLKRLQAAETEEMKEECRTEWQHQREMDVLRLVTSRLRRDGASRMPARSTPSPGAIEAVDDRPGERPTTLRAVESPREGQGPTEAC